MEGVVLFADDNIHSYSLESDTVSQSNENKLFKKLAESYPVLGVKDLTSAEKAVKSIGTFSALILDWEFKNMQELTDSIEDDTASMVRMPSGREEETFEFLNNNEIYTFIYIYSTNKVSIEEQYGERLKNKYPNRIEFRDKNNLADTETECKVIIERIKEWRESNKNLSLPIQWSQSINQSVQKIFSKLQSADPNWITELYNTSVKDGVNPSVEVINLFQNVLSENIIQDNNLNNQIADVAKAGAPLAKPEDYAQLMRIVFYGNPKNTDPIMTGDIFQVEDTDEYFIVITPECDIRHIADVQDKKFEVLAFKKGDYKKSHYGLKASIKAKPLIDKAESYNVCAFSKAQKTEISQELNNQIKSAEKKLVVEGFTQTNSRYHIIPCFDFDKNDLTGIIFIDFRFALNLHDSLGPLMNKANRVAKLNTPYIQELRQRYLSYKGRVGVPGYSNTLREWIIEKK